jgi:hypothetical protein
MLKLIRPDGEVLSCRPSDKNDVKNAAFRELVATTNIAIINHIYIDGSKMDEKTGYAVVTPNRPLRIRLVNEACAFAY